MNSVLTMPRTTLEALADATRTPLPWRPPQRPVTREPIPPPLTDALATFGSPEVIVDLDLVVRGGGQLCSWHRLRGARVTAVSAADDATLALAWFDAARWPGALAQAATVEAPDVGPPPPATVDVAFDALVAGRAGARLRDSAGRLRVTVAGRRGVGWVSWVLFTDGWRELTPYVERGVPMVRLRSVPPERLGERVVRLAAGAR